MYKKVLVLFLVIFIFIILYIFLDPKNEQELNEVKFSSCVDGDTAWFKIDGKNTKVRFLAIDTPESNEKIEYYGKQASAYTCKMLKEAKKITLEKDPKADFDNHGRSLFWVYVDDELLQGLLVENGYAKVKYIKDKYRYLDILNEKQSYAKRKKLGIWK